MNRLVLALLLLLTGYTAGTVMVSPRLPNLAEAGRTLTPFLIISIALLIASLGYVVRCILPKKGGRNDHL